MTYHQAIKGSMYYEIVLREGISRVFPGLAVNLIYSTNLDWVFIVNFLLLLFDLVTRFGAFVTLMIQLRILLYLLVLHNALPVLLNIESQIFHFLIH